MSNISASPLRHAAAALLFIIMLAAVIFLAAGHPQGAAGGKISSTGKWTCSMCPQFILPAPGKCPKCFMDLIPLESEAGSGGRYELILSRNAAEAAGIHTVIVDHEAPEPASGVSTSSPEKSADGEGSSVVYLPASAVLQNVGRAFVFVEMDEGDSLSFTMREIALGDIRKGIAEVKSGLNPGEAVVSSGAFRLDSALQILGKISLVNLPAENLALVPQEEEREPYQPAERSPVDLRMAGVPLDDWFKDYEAVRAALAKDDFTGSFKPSGQFFAAVAGESGAGRTDADSGLAKPEVAGSEVAGSEFANLRQSLVRDAGLLKSSKNLDEKRDAFEKVTADMVLLARKYGAPKSKLNLIFCPMAFGGTGAYWMQPQDKVDNPYHGLEMPECGWQVERLEP